MHKRNNTGRNSNQSIPCPDCQASIIFDVYSLLRGESARCEKCGAELSIASESADTLKDTLAEFEKLQVSSSDNKQYKITGEFDEQTSN